MTAIGLFVFFLGYAVLYWGLQAVQGNSQQSFVTYIVPWAK